MLAASGLRERGHRVYIGCHKHSFIEQHAIERQIPVVHIEIFSDFSFWGALKLIQHCKHLQPDVIIGCQNRDIKISGFLKKSLGNPLVISRQGVKLIHNNFKYKWLFKSFCDGIITNTRSIKDEYDSYGWWPGDYVKVIHNGVEEPGIHILPFNYHAYLPKTTATPKIILSAGRLSKQKGFHFLIKAVREVCQHHQNVYLFIVGKGKLRHQLKKQIENEGLQDRVFLIGFWDDMAPLFKQADLFVLSSLFEGMPNVVMEAMINKVPVISTDVNGVSELIDSGKSGFIVRSADSNALAEAMIQFFHIKDHQPMVNEAYRKITSQFSVDKMVDQLEEYLLGKLGNSFEGWKEMK